ncbi:MAG: alpha-galactosidase [Herpetosiphonaceae bacterium]|nr:alpha-galactosidase [Herpetosiphonaceae bacterium]
MDIRISHNAPSATALALPDFPLVRFDTGMVVYEEALLNGQYLVVNTSAMGRPKFREWIWQEYGDPTAIRPARTRQHAFRLVIDGQLLADQWEWVDAHEVVASRTGCREAVVMLRHIQRPVTVEIHTRIDDTALLTRWLQITNTGEQHAAVAEVFPWSGQVWEPVGNSWNTASLPTAPFSIGRFTDSSAGTEGSFDWGPVGEGASGFESMNGRSGWGAPFCLLRNEVTGENCVMHLGWSGNWQINLFNDDEPARWPIRDARIYAQLGLAGPAPLRVLEPGETAQTPAAHIGFLFGDLDACVQELHTHIRRSVALEQPAGREHRVEVNHTGYTRNLQVTEYQLYQEMDMTADVGAELFLLDAGWFGKASDRWFEAVGDWDDESRLLPGGVQGIFAAAHERGLLGGLWVEAERMGPTSRLIQEHPEWQMQRRGKAIPNLDLVRPEVAAYFEQTIIGLIEKYRLDCFRIDYNISIGEGGEAERGGYTENVLWRYYEALYAIFDRIHARFPEMLLENCSSGGGRTDLGIMARFHWTQVTDLWAPAPTIKIINGMTLLLPPELCESVPGGISDGVADLDFMLRIGLFGHYCVSGIFPALEQQHAGARERWRHTIELYKSFVRPMLGSCKLFHHTPIQRQREPGDWVVLEAASAEGDRAYAGIFRLQAATSDYYHFLPRGLAADQRYRVRFDSTGRSYEVNGHHLIEQGLQVRLAGVFTSELLLFEVVLAGE